MNKITFKIWFVVSIFILVAVAYGAFFTFRDFENDSTWVAHGQRVKTKIESLSGLPKEISNEIRRAAIMGDTLDEKLISNTTSEISLDYYELDSLILNDPEQSGNADQLIMLINDYLENTDSLIKIMATHYTLNEHVKLLIQKQEMWANNISAKAEEMMLVENKLLQQRIIERKESRFWTPLALLILTILTLCIITVLFINILALLDKNEQAASHLRDKVKELNIEITEKTTLQTLLKNVLNSSPNGIMAFSSIRDNEGKITDFKFTTVNSTAANMVEVTEEEILNSSMLELLPGNKTSGLYDKYVKVVENGKDLHLVKYYDHDKFSTWFDITAVKNGDGVVITFTDITEQKEHENELMNKQNELENTNFELEQFAYIASHDLQEPLRKVRAFGDRLRNLFNSNLGEKGLDYISRMQNAAERMQILINDLLKFSRISRSELIEIPVNLNEILTELLEDLEVEIEKKNAVIKNDLLPTVSGDKGQYKQLLQNLISNALKYSKTDIPPVIEIVAEPTSFKIPGTKVSKDGWKLIFKDNGIGFDPKYKKQIFVIFQRLHGRMEYTGTGIGLAICEKIVTNHGGMIEADAQIGKGAEFIVYLPK